MQWILQLLDFMVPYGAYSYGLMFLLLLACGFGFPMPEDIILISGGILSARGVVDYHLVFVVTMLGVLMGDGVVFTIGRRLGPRAKKTRFYQRMITEKREKVIDKWFQNHGNKVVFFARFAPGLRMPLFMTAGIYQVSYLRFFLLDGFAAIISVPAWIWVGYIFGANMELLHEKMHSMQVGIYAVLGGVLLFIFLSIWVKKRFMAIATDGD